MVVENESSSGVTGWTLESEEDDRGRTGVRGDEVVLAAPGGRGASAVAAAVRWGLVVTEFDPGPADGPGPVRFLGTWRTSPQPPHPLVPGPVVVVLTAHGGVAPESAEAGDAGSGRDSGQAADVPGILGPGSTVSVHSGLGSPDRARGRSRLPAVIAESEFRAGRTTLRADEADGPIPRLLSAVWRRSARPPVPAARAKC